MVLYASLAPHIPCNMPSCRCSVGLHALKHICAATQLYLPCYVRISYNFILLLPINAKTYTLWYVLLMVLFATVCPATCLITGAILLYMACYVSMPCNVPCRATCLLATCYISPPCNMQVAGGRHSLRRIATTMPFTKSGKPTKKKSYIGKSMDKSRIGDQWKYGHNLQIWSKYNYMVGFKECFHCQGKVT